MSRQDEGAAPGPLELLESARTKYSLALARVRRGPPELALLSVHGSLEDVLRAHGMRLQLAEAYGSFPQLLDALTQAEQLPLSGPEADGIKRMHRLRARVAHGEQIAVAAETLDAYHRLAARLLPRYGVMVVGPEGPEAGAGERQAATATTVPGRRGDTTALVRRDGPETRRRGDTAALDRNLAGGPPRRERTVYPDDRPARYAGRVLPSAATRDLPLAREMMGGRRGGWEGRLADAWERSQRWLLPTIIVISMFLVGLVISASLGQMRAVPVAPTAAVAVTALAAPPTALPAAPGAGAAATAPAGVAEGAAATAVPALVTATAGPGELAVGRTAFVRADAEALNVRERPGTVGANAVVVTLQPGTGVEIIGGPTVADGLTWWQVRAASVEGWSAGQWLEVR